MDDADVLIELIGQYVSSAAANQLRNLLAAARNAQTLADWNSATGEFRQRYRDLVKQEMRGFIPPPILALPSVQALVAVLLDRALDEGERAIASAAREVALGPASASLSLPPVMLPAPELPVPAALIGFKPPTGLALSFEVGPASGGGALDYQRSPNPRLSGALGLKLGILQVSALAILEEVGRGYSLLTLISARFAPGIQLGFGFAVTGVGGLIGVNRAADAGALEGHFRSGALANALFGDDPIGNAVTTLKTLGAVFPALMGAHVFGPSLQLSWLKVGTFTLFSVDLGVFMALPGPSRIDIIGSARAGIPLLFQLRLDVRGELDFARRVISIQAVIVDSYVMGVFKLQGEAIFRMRYGDDPYVVLTIGGFFPGFNPAPAELPSHIQRVGMALDLPVDLPVYLRVEGYLAVTANTLQFGAHMEAGFDAGVFSAQGHFLLDALFQFDPFQFDVRFSAGFHIEVLGEGFSGVRCSGNITGPGPVVIHAQIAYETPFFLPDIEWSDTFTIGRAAPRVSSTPDLFQEMRKELRALANLRAENGEDPHVALSVKSPQVNDQALLSPLGSLVWSQRLAPLNLELQRLQNAPLATPAGARVSAAGQDADAPRERFNLGMYRHLSDAERMNLNAQVEEHVAGVRHRYETESGPVVPCSIEFEEYRRPNPVSFNSPFIKMLSGALLHKVSEAAALAQVANLAPRVSTKREAWQGGAQACDTQAEAHVIAAKRRSVAHLVMDTVDVGEV